VFVLPRFKDSPYRAMAYFKVLVKMQTAQTMPGRRVIERKMPPRSEKHENFRRLAEARTHQVLEALRKLSNLSSSNYEFEDFEVEKIFLAIEQGVEEARGRFRRDLHKRGRFTL
jgi:hypothetical protein